MAEQKFYRITQADIDKAKTKGVFMKAGPRKSAPLRFSGAPRMWTGTGGAHPRAAQPDVIYVPEIRLAGNKDTVRAQLTFNQKELSLNDKAINNLVENAISNKNYSSPSMKKIVDELNDEIAKTAATKSKNKVTTAPNITALLKEAQGHSDKKSSQKNKTKVTTGSQQRAAGSFYQKISQGGIYDVSGIDDKGGKARKLAQLPNMGGRSTKRYLNEFNQVVSSDAAAYRRAMNLLAAEDKANANKYMGYADKFDSSFGKAKSETKSETKENKSDDKAKETSSTLSTPARKPTLTATSNNTNGPVRSKLNISLKNKA